MVIRIAKSKPDTWLSDVIDIELRVPWRGNRHLREHAHSIANKWDMDDLEELADLSEHVKNVLMTNADDAVHGCELSVR